MTTETPLTYANIFGDPVSLDPSKHARKKVKRELPDEGYHKGWRVIGIPPGALEEAKRQYLADAAIEAADGKTPKPWDEHFWLMNAKGKPVRSKPYEIPEAAKTCKRMAEASGWLRVEIVELKKEKNKEPA